MEQNRDELAVAEDKQEAAVIKLRRKQVGNPSRHYKKRPNAWRRKFLHVMAKSAREEGNPAAACAPATTSGTVS